MFFFFLVSKLVLNDFQIKSKIPLQIKLQYNIIETRNKVFLLICEQHKSKKNSFQVCDETWVGDIISTVVTCLAEASCSHWYDCVLHQKSCHISTIQLSKTLNLHAANGSGHTWTEESSKSKIPGNIYLTYVNTMGQSSGSTVTAGQKKLQRAQNSTRLRFRASSISAGINRSTKWKSNMFTK